MATTMETSYVSGISMPDIFRPEENGRVAHDSERPVRMHQPWEHG